MPFDSPEAAALNREIFETIYFAALVESCALAADKGPYESYTGSPVSAGVLQHDMWGVPDSDRTWAVDGQRIGWRQLRGRISVAGVRNSLLVAPMPTASTSQILGNTECFEAHSSHIYVRRVLSGEFVVVNKHLLADLTEAGLWDADMKTAIIAANGSVQGNERVPERLQQLYKTTWELKQRTLVDMAADRGAYVDQSQSLNIYMADATASKMTSLHFHSWSRGLKTGMYYLRTRAAADAVKFTVDPTAVQRACSRANKDDCAACSA